MQRVPDRIRDCVGIGERFVVPESDHFEALRSQPFIAIDVISVISMLRTIRFNNQAPLEIYKVDDVPTEYLLPFEFEAREAVAAKDRPYTALGLGGVCAHSLGAIEHGCMGCAPSPCSLRELSLSRKGRGVSLAGCGHGSRQKPQRALDQILERLHQLRPVRAVDGAVVEAAGGAHHAGD